MQAPEDKDFSFFLYKCRRAGELSVTSDPSRAVRETFCMQQSQLLDSLFNAPQNPIE